MSFQELLVMLASVAFSVLLATGLLELLLAVATKFFFKDKS